MDDEQAKLLADRKETHGDFSDHAGYSIAFKAVIEEAKMDRAHRGQKPLLAIQEEAMHMIVHKLARALAGDPDLPDHWDDVGGYAKITSQRIERDRKVSDHQRAVAQS